jgi:hypothetical protein
MWLFGGNVWVTGIHVLRACRGALRLVMIDMSWFLDPGLSAGYMAGHDDHDHDPPEYPPPRRSGAGGRSLDRHPVPPRVARHTPKSSAPILAVMNAKD